MMSAQQKKFVATNILLITLINIVVGAGIGYLVFSKQPAVPLWGPQGLALDTVLSSFLLPFVTCLLLYMGIKKAIADGKVKTIPMHQTGWFAQPSAGKFTVALLIGILVTVLIAPLVLVALEMIGPQYYQPTHAIALKALYGGLLSLLVVPFIARLALRAQP
jgi:uncharacterized protein YacL